MSTKNIQYQSASYIPCSFCGEGAIVWDPETESSRCSACSERDR